MMLALLHTLGTFILDLLKSRRRLQAENLFLRHQLNIALRKASPRAQLRGADRALLVWMTRVFPDLLSLAKVNRRRVFVGIAPGSRHSGGGSLGGGQGARRSIIVCVISSNACARKTGCGERLGSMASC
jgi:hypothetical protein